MRQILARLLVLIVCFLAFIGYNVLLVDKLLQTNHLVLIRAIFCFFLMPIDSSISKLS